MYTLLTLMLGHAALAQEPVQTAEGQLQAPDPQLETLRAELAEARAGAAETAALERLLTEAGALVDPRSADERRVAAARALGESPDPRAWPFLASAVRHGSAEVRVAALGALEAYPVEDTVALADSVLRNPSYALDVRQAAMALLVEVEVPSAGEVLYRFVTDSGQDPELRRQALKLLREKRPEVLAAFGEPPPPAEKSGPEAGIGVVANGVTGGILLSSVGALGQSGGGVVIGAIGGGLIGVGTGITYALTRPVSLSNNLQYAAGVGWGLELGVMGTYAIYGERTPESREEVGATLRAAGVGLGAGLAYARFKKGVDPIDVVELNTATWIGQQVALGGASVALSQNDGYGDVWDDGVQPRMTAGIAGAAVGAGIGWVARDRWDLDAKDAVFGGVTLAAGTWTGAWLPIALGESGRNGVPRLVGHGLAGGALLLSELTPVSTRRSATLAYGFVAGNALGAGVPMLAGLNEDQTVASSMLASGAVGAGVGYLVGDHLNPKPGDYALVGIGMPIVLAEATALAGVMDDTGIFAEWRQAPGFILTTSGLGAMGLLAAGYAFDPQPGQVVLVGTSAAWGAWYGALTPIALGLEGDRNDLILATVGTADVFMLAGGLTQLPIVGLDPKRTLVPQLGGVGGATLGALVVGLATADGQAVAGGAVVGSLLGFGGGTVIELARRPKPGQALVLPRPHVDLPGTWSVSGMPTPNPDGSLGLQLSLTGFGF